MPSEIQPNPQADVACRDMRGRDIARVVAMTGRFAAHHGEAATLTAEILQREAFSSTPLVPTLQLQFGARGMELHHLHVEEAARGRGVGRALIAASIERARGVGCGFLTIGAHPGNARARQFYERCGFQPVTVAGPRFRIALGGEATGIRLAG